MSVRIFSSGMEEAWICLLNTMCRVGLLGAQLESLGSPAVEGVVSECEKRFAVVRGCLWNVLEPAGGFLERYP